MYWICSRYYIGIWDTNYSSDNWEPEFMIIFGTWYFPFLQCFISILKKSIHISLPSAEFSKLQIGETLIKCSRHAHQSLITLIVSGPCSKSLSNCSCICMAFMAEKESSFSGINSNYIFINHQTNAKISEVALVNAQ